MRGFIFKEVPQVGQKTNKLMLVYVIVICIYLQAIYKITFHLPTFCPYFLMYFQPNFMFSHIIIALPHVEDRF
jgi:hypothetical protein